MYFAVEFHLATCTKKRHGKHHTNIRAGNMLNPDADRSVSGGGIPAYSRGRWDGGCSRRRAGIGKVAEASEACASHMIG